MNISFCKEDLRRKSGRLLMKGENSITGYCVVLRFKSAKIWSRSSHTTTQHPSLLPASRAATFWKTWPLHFDRNLAAIYLSILDVVLFSCSAGLVSVEALWSPVQCCCSDHGEGLGISVMFIVISSLCQPVQRSRKEVGSTSTKQGEKKSLGPREPCVLYNI